LARYPPYLEQLFLASQTAVFYNPTSESQDGDRTYAVFSATVWLLRFVSIFLARSELANYCIIFNMTLCRSYVFLLGILSMVCFPDVLFFSSLGRGFGFLPGAQVCYTYGCPHNDPCFLSGVSVRAIVSPDSFSPNLGEEYCGPLVGCLCSCAVPPSIFALFGRFRA
jgi:hypothetical protein